MSIGNSGRIVIEIDPETKRNLYSVLTRNGITLKEWFLKCADGYMAGLSPTQIDNKRSATAKQKSKILKKLN
jgi:hypothetical protein